MWFTRYAIKRVSNPRERAEEQDRVGAQRAAEQEFFNISMAMAGEGGREGGREGGLPVTQLQNH